MKRIIFILQTPPPFHGSTIVGDQIQEIITNDNSFTSLFINTNLSNNISEIGKNSIYKYVKYIQSLFLLCKNLINFKPNLVYIAITVNGIGFIKDLLYVFIIKIFAKKIVFHFHNKGVSTNNSFLYKKLYNFTFKNEYAFILSNKLEYDIEYYFDQNNIFVCPNAIKDINTITNNIQTQNKPIKLLFISNLLISKGIYDLIETCKILNNNNFSFICNIIGAEKDLSKFDINELILNNNLQENVVYHGPKYDNEKNELLENSHILIYPSHSDCLPLVLIEACQYYLPIIATNEGAISDVVVDKYNGFIIEKHSPNLIFEKIKLLINNDDLYCQMRKNSRNVYDSKFTIDKFKQNIIKNINTIINEKIF